MISHHSEARSSETPVVVNTIVKNPAGVIVGREKRYERVVEILVGLQEAVLQVSDRGEESLPPTTRKPIMTILLERLQRVEV